MGTTAAASAATAADEVFCVIGQSQATQLLVRCTHSEEQLNCATGGTEKWLALNRRDACITV